MNRRLWTRPRVDVSALVLFEKSGAESRLNHLGVAVASSDEVWAHQARLSGEGIDSC